MSPYHAARYYDQDTGRFRWAVFHLHTRAWYFAQRHGKAPAQALARRLSRSAA